MGHSSLGEQARGNDPEVTTLPHPPHEVKQERLLVSFFTEVYSSVEIKNQQPFFHGFHRTSGEDAAVWESAAEMSTLSSSTFGTFRRILIIPRMKNSHRNTYTGTRKEGISEGF